MLLYGQYVFYKHHDSNFYSAGSYVIGKAMALLPQLTLDTLLLGTMIYWLANFVASAKEFGVFLLVVFTFNLMMSQLFGFLTALAPTRSLYLSAATVTIFANTVCSGYIINPGL